MKVRFIKPIVLALSLVLLCPTAWASLLIRDVRILSPDREPTGELVNVLIEEGRISAIGGQRFPARETLDGKGRYLTPGLIDAHVHLEGVPGDNGNLPETVRQQALAQIPRSYLYFGFTTVLDLIGTEAVIRDWNAQALAPRAYYCAPVPIPGGYPLAWLPEEQQLSVEAAHFYLYDPRRPELMAGLEDSEQHRPGPLMERIAASGARCIKTFYETGFGRLRNLPVPSQEMMRELVAAAHKHGLPVYLHGNSREAYEFAAATSVDMLVHGLWNGIDPAEEKTLESLANAIDDAGLAVQPTLQVLHGEVELFDPAFFARPEVLATIPPALLDWYQSEAGRWLLGEIASGIARKGEIDVSAVDLEQARHAYRTPLSVAHDFTSHLVRRGVPLSFGTDTPSGPIYTQFPGVNGYGEMQRWWEVGISLPDLFRALTLGNAERMGLGDELGTLAEGKAADLLLLEHNPLESIEAYDSIVTVFVRGVPIDRRELSAAGSRDY